MSVPPWRWHAIAKVTIVCRSKRFHVKSYMFITFSVYILAMPMELYMVDYLMSRNFIINYLVKLCIIYRLRPAATVVGNPTSWTVAFRSAGSRCSGCWRSREAVAGCDGHTHTCPASQLCCSCCAYPLHCAAACSVSARPLRPAAACVVGLLC
jgi:hypothetical protein